MQNDEEPRQGVHASSLGNLASEEHQAYNAAKVFLSTNATSTFVDSSGKTQQLFTATTADFNNSFVYSDYANHSEYRDFYWNSLGVNIKPQNPTPEEQAVYDERQLEVYKQTVTELALAGATGALTYGSVKYINGKITKITTINEQEVNVALEKIAVENGANAATYPKLKLNLKTVESANEAIESLATTGQLPFNYVTKDQAKKAGWSEGKAVNNYVPGGQIGGDVYQNSTGLLPSAPGRVWYEADIGLSNTMARSNEKQPASRLLYSSDGLVYVTPDHYETMLLVGTWK